MHGHVERIWIKRFHRGPIDDVDRVEARAGRGLVGNADQGAHRQVTIIARGRWSVVAQALDTDVNPALRRANLLVDVIDLEQSRNKVLRVGRCWRDASVRTDG